MEIIHCTFLQATPVLEVMGVEPGDETLFSLALQFLYIRCDRLGHYVLKALPLLAFLAMPLQVTVVLTNCQLCTRHQKQANMHSSCKMCGMACNWSESTVGDLSPR